MENIDEMLPLYYKRLFPYGPFFRWLTYGDEENKDKKSKYLQNREFSFALEDDVIIRYQSFESKEDFEKEIQKRCPRKIDIGAVFTLPPKSCRMKSEFQPTEKEMVFDIDLTDYDEVRTCCKESSVCNKCWKFMIVACKILDVALEEDFGWGHRLWVFSGRRGIHCWICDESARKLDASQRAAAAEYLQLLVGGKNQNKKVQLSGDLHPSVKRAIGIVEKYFEDIVLKDQDILQTGEGCNKFLQMILDENLIKLVKEDFKNSKTSIDRWNAFVTTADTFNRQENWKRKTKYIKEEIMLQYIYPRLDINVSKGLNHLLKSPFCVHPKTGKICVPFLPRNVDTFDPTTVPTIQLLLDEIAKYDKQMQEHKANENSNVKVKDYKKTSLNKSVTVFEQFVRPLELKWKRRNAETGDHKMEF